MSQLSETKVTIYTDGACSGNPGPGGWGAYLIYNGHEKDIYGSEGYTTNNRMELLAAIRALDALKKPCNVELYTDSVYVRSGITEWINKWLKNNWRNSKKEPVKNADLWQDLHDKVGIHKINWHWVKGHSNNYGNERADMLACKGRDLATQMV